MTTPAHISSFLEPVIDSVKNRDLGELERLLCELDNKARQDERRKAGIRETEAFLDWVRNDDEQS